jgi:hypothetical protein
VTVESPCAVSRVCAGDWRVQLTDV